MKSLSTSGGESSPPSKASPWQRARIDVIDYRDEAAGEMPQDALTRITLRPQITVSTGAERPVTQARILHLCQVAHRECYVSNSLRTPIAVEPTVMICPSSDGRLTSLNQE